MLMFGEDPEGPILGELADELRAPGCRGHHQAGRDLPCRVEGRGEGIPDGVGAFVTSKQQGHVGRPGYPVRCLGRVLVHIGV
jgi:hypothetical protein